MKWIALTLMLLLPGLGLSAEDPAVAAAAAVAQAPAVARAAAPPAAGGAPGADVAVPQEETVPVKDGYSLLKSLLTLFDDIPVVKAKKTPESEVKMSGGLVEVDNRLSYLFQSAKAALDAGVVDKIFYNRYKRMLSIYKMVITPVVKNELLENPFMKSFEDFVWDVTYENWVWGEKDSIPKMAAAMEEEFVQLMIYLDTRKKSEELKRKIGYRMLPPPPPAKKKVEEKKPE